MKVLVFNQQNAISLATSSVKPVVKSVLALEKQACDEVAIYFVDTQEISRLHKEFFDDPSPTDCISFPMDSQEEAGYKMLGEVFVCPQTAVEYLLREGEGVTDDVYCETTLYLVHALLHLLGYEDKDESAIKKMRSAENRHMHHLIKAGFLLAGE